MQALELLRAFARYKTHAGYSWAAAMADGELMCERCVRENYRQCYRETRDESHSDWACIGLTSSGEAEESASCVHCNRTLWETRTMPKLSFSEALQAINDGQSVHSADVQARALRRMVWVAEWHIPGCLSESFIVCTTKRDAIERALSMAEGELGAPRGMRADLERFGRSNRTAPDAWARGAVTTIERRALADIL